MSLQEHAEGVYPDTRKAILVCEGKCIRPTVHFYEKTVTENKGGQNGHSEYGNSFYFACKPCGAVRQYGFEGIRLFGEE